MSKGNKIFVDALLSASPKYEWVDLGGNRRTGSLEEKKSFERAKAQYGFYKGWSHPD